MTDNLMTIVECAHCKKAMRVPTNKGHIRFECPDCKAQLEWSPPPSSVTPEVIVDQPTHPATPSPSTGNAGKEDDGGPWTDIGAGIFVGLIALFLIGVTADIHEILVWIILLVAAPAAGMLFYRGIKGLLAGVVSKFHADKATKGKPTPTSSSSPLHGDGWRARTHFIIAALIVAVLNIFIPVLDTLPEGPITIIGSMILLGLTVQCMYYVFRGIRLAFARGVGASIAMTMVAFYLISLVPEGLKLVAPNMLSGISLFESALPDGHFKDVKVEETTPSELDELMEDW